MDLIFLGTSAGAPTRNRNVSGTALIESSGKGWYLVDCGEATQHQLLRTPLTLKNLRGCFITHVHGDHCFGLPGLLATAGMSGRLEPLDIVLPVALHDWVRLSLSASRSCLSFEVRLHASETLNGWRNGHVQVDTVALSHRVPSHGYLFAESNPDPRLDVQRLEAEGIPRGPIWGELAHGREVEHAGRLLRAQDYLCPARPGQRFIICGDNDTPDLLAKVVPGADVLVHEATFCQSLIDRTRESYGHSSAAAVARFAESAGIPNLVLTHFSARYQSNPGQSPFIGDIHEEAAACFTGQLILAQDLQRYHLDRDGRLQVVMERLSQ
ncbi:MBL fold metallo-hydrolase [Pseudomonas silesiensis]|uniref:Ribonuclease Z n=1 Tax=Pseudomonas silesiensis TaxID=1853130 RepID=A0A191YRI4_9PSED|nr:MBL fold metallo-hydrolase [Pseudomonas silesiensis]ANJ55482.1 MBL fold metallo-hydrolase [Pseudomonas silesiensis]